MRGEGQEVGGISLFLKIHYKTLPPHHTPELSNDPVANAQLNEPFFAIFTALRGVNLNYWAVAMQNCYPPYFRPFKSNGRDI